MNKASFNKSDLSSNNGNITDQLTSMESTSSGSSSFFGSLTENPFFSAGFGLMGITVGLSFLRTGFQQATVLARRQCFVTLEIPSKDKSYHWVLQWISARAATSTRHLSVGKRIFGNQ